MDLDPEELPDSRQMQFVAFRHQTWDYIFPNWINQSDYDRALENGDVTVPEIYSDDDILTAASEWPTTEWVRITPDEERLPITIKRAKQGVTWDLMDVPIGTWMIAAYTFEPERNAWSVRQGAARVFDSANPNQDPGPSAFLQNQPEEWASAGDPISYTACVQAQAGATFTASWGLVQAGVDPSWVDFATDEPIAEGSAIELNFSVPTDTTGAIKVRVKVTEPDGDEYTAFLPYVVEVWPSQGETDGETSGASTGGQSGGCAVDQPNPIALLLGVLLLAFRVRRVAES